MACMEHNCLNCNNIWFNNAKSGNCPECGSDDTRSYFDEEPQWEKE